MVLKKMKKIVALPLKLIFNRSMLSNKLPLEWKSELRNCRPVSLTTVPCKIMESIITDKMLKFAQENSFMTSDQHGFMKSRSCLTNVLETLEDWTKALHSGYGIDVIYLYYQKAFDTVPHKRLLKKLKWYGFIWIWGVVALDGGFP